MTSKDQRTHCDESEIIDFYYKSKSRHLNLNALKKEHFSQSPEIAKSVAVTTEESTPKLIGKGIVPILLVLILAFAGCDSLTSPRLNYSPEFTWKYNGKGYKVKFYFSKSIYDHYALKPRTKDFTEYVKEDSTEPYLSYIAEQLYELVEDEKLTPTQLSAFVLSFVQRYCH